LLFSHLVKVRPNKSGGRAKAVGKLVLTGGWCLKIELIIRLAVKPLDVTVSIGAFNNYNNALCVSYHRKP
jgi:hypothetical protein